MNETWLLDQATLDAMHRAIERGVMPTAEQQAELEAAAMQPESRIMRVSGPIAQISVEGVLTERPNFFARYYGPGNTTYGEIDQALAQAQADSDIKEAYLDIRSGGGQASDALFSTLAAIEAFSKPITARIRGVGASAAYAIASQADKIVASNKATRVGSIGVVVQFLVQDDIVTITSSKAPNKAPDLTTEEGKATVRAELDDLHAIFVDAIAKGRKTSVDKVNAEYGMGSVLLASDALERGMIDGIVASIPETATTTTANTKMTLAELKAQHQEAYQAAVSEGVNQERKRASDHLKMAETSGASELAFKAIKEGTPLADIQVDYMAALMARKETDSRQEDSDAANAAADKAKDKNPEQDQGDQTWAAFTGSRPNFIAK